MAPRLTYPKLLNQLQRHDSPRKHPTLRVCGPEDNADTDHLDKGPWEGYMWQAQGSAPKAA